MADAAKALREHILWLLDGGHAHLDFNRATDEFPLEAVGKRAPGLPHTGWELVEHLRLAQRDVLDYCRDPEHAPPAWPDGYWPAAPGPAEEAIWLRSLEAFRSDAAALRQLIADPVTDLLAGLPHAPEHTLLREALIVADHNAYHLGQLVDVRKALGVWEAR
jgi:hypothetical protein